MFKYPCYQQGASDCGYWCLRIAAEISMRRRFTREEAKTFTAFKRQCAKAGSCLSLSTARFAAAFPDLGVHFNPSEAYAAEEFVSPAMIKSALDAGRVVVLNIQRVALRRDALVPGEKDGHNVCCVGYDERDFIFHDSNKYRNKCRKTMRISDLQEGYDRVVSAGDDLEARVRAMSSATYASEMYVADTTRRDAPPRRMSLRRRTQQRV